MYHTRNIYRSCYSIEIYKNIWIYVACTWCAPRTRGILAIVTVTIESALPLHYCTPGRLHGRRPVIIDIVITVMRGLSIPHHFALSEYVLLQLGFHHLLIFWSSISVILHCVNQVPTAELRQNNYVQCLQKAKRSKGRYTMDIRSTQCYV